MSGTKSVVLIESPPPKDKGQWSVQEVNDVCVCLHTWMALKMNEGRMKKDNGDRIEHDLCII